MKNSFEFLKKVLDSVTEHIVVIDDAGDIQYVNKSWSTFGNDNACVVGDEWGGVNYLSECDKASSMGDEYGTNAGAGIRSVIEKNKEIFYYEYPCHSPTEKRWFMMRVTPFDSNGVTYYVISHQNITERKLAEEEAISLARIDGLTKIPNRRTFDVFLREEFRRCARLSKPISLAIIDLDHFKLLNDTYGHQVGDECLLSIGSVLKNFANRPSDICARFGGEEFALVWGDTDLEQGKFLASSILESIAGLEIENKSSPTHQYITASIGLGTLIPSKASDEADLINMADRMLYKAKKTGRNKVVG